MSSLFYRNFCPTLITFSLKTKISQDPPKSVLIWIVACQAWHKANLFSCLQTFSLACTHILWHSGWCIWPWEYASCVDNGRLHSANNMATRFMRLLSKASSRMKQCDLSERFRPNVQITIFFHHSIYTRTSEAPSSHLKSITGPCMKQLWKATTFSIYI